MLSEEEKDSKIYINYKLHERIRNHLKIIVY